MTTPDDTHRLAADPEPGDPTRLVARLRSLQEKQRKRVHHVETATADLERRTVRLRSVERSIADLERRVAGPLRQAAEDGSSTEPALIPALLIFNPGAGRRAEDNTLRLTAIVRGLRAHGIEARIGLKTSGKAARTLAEQAVRDGCALVVVAGGDGTLQDVASQLIGSSTVLGIIPTGTMNNVARSLGIPLDIDDACALIGMGTTRHIDVGRVVGDGRPSVEYFLDCAGVGLLAIAALAGQSLQKGRWGLLPRVLRSVLRARRLGGLRVEIDDLVLRPSTEVVTVSNAPLMGNRLLAAPDAKMDDGLLDVAVYDGMKRGALARHLRAAAAGTDDGQVVSYRARRVRICADAPMPTNSDMALPEPRALVEIEVVPGALCVIVGNGIGLTVPVEAAPAAPADAPDPPVFNGEARPEA